MRKLVTSALRAVTRWRIVLCHVVTDSITTGTPGPLASGTRKVITGPTMNPAVVGIKTLSHHGAFTTCSRKVVPEGHRKCWKISMRVLKKSDPTAANTPILKEKKRK
jgi:hypothetical protein